MTTREHWQGVYTTKKSTEVSWYVAHPRDDVAPLGARIIDVGGGASTLFHFLTAASDRRAYVERLQSSVVSGGHAVFGTFSPSGPTKCSGLEVVRYDAESLGREIGSEFTLVAQHETGHVTPGGSTQKFLFCCFRKR